MAPTKKPKPKTKPKKTTGRRTKLTPELAEELISLLREGVPVKNAAEIVGISEATYYAWRSKGEESKSGAFLEFAEATKKARSERVKKLLNMLEGFMFTDWKAIAWYLERQHPQQFGKKALIPLDKTSAQNDNMLVVEHNDPYIPEKEEKT